MENLKIEKGKGNYKEIITTKKRSICLKMLGECVCPVDQPKILNLIILCQELLPKKKNKQNLELGILVVI